MPCLYVAADQHHQLERLNQLSMKQDALKGSIRAKNVLKTFKPLSSSTQFAVTMSVSRNEIYNHKAWFDEGVRETLSIQVWKSLRNSMNRYVHNSYNRNPHLRFHSTDFVEHFSREGIGVLTHPHVHATLEVPIDAVSKFEEVLIPQSFMHEGCLVEGFKPNYSMIKGNHDSVSSCFIRRIDDLEGWIDYSIKQQQLTPHDEWLSFDNRINHLKKIGILQ